MKRAKSGEKKGIKILVNKVHAKLVFMSVIFDIGIIF